MPFIVAAQAALDRAVGSVLEPDVQSGGHGEAVLVQTFAPYLSFEMLPDLFHEEGCDPRRLIRLTARHDGLLFRGIGLGLRQVAFVRHPLKDTFRRCVARFMSTKGLWRSGS